MSTLDPLEWEKRLSEKQTKALSKSSSLPDADVRLLSGRLLRNTALAQTLYTLGTGSSRPLRYIGAAIWRRITELQAELQLRRLASKARDKPYGQGLIQSNEKAVSSIRVEWLQLQSLVLQGRFSAALKSRVLQHRAQAVSRQLSAEASCPPVEPFQDLIQLVSAVCCYALPESVQRNVWDILLCELRRGSAKHLVAAVDIQDKDVPVILRHMAACKLAAWKTIPSQHSLDSTEDAKNLTRRQAFESRTYGEHVTLTTGFYDLLSGLLERCPQVVHTAFDDRHMHLLWLPKYLADRRTYDMIELAFVFDDLSLWYHPFAKRLNATLPHEVDCLVRFLATNKDGVLLKGTAEHLRTAVLPLSHVDSPSFSAAVDEVYNAHPGLKAGELAHPALPFLLFAARLLPHSQKASEMLMEGYFVEALRDLWVKNFPRGKNYQTGRYVPDASRLAAMRIACVLTLGAMATHSDLRPRLAARLMESEATASWFWDIAAHALYMTLYPKGSHWLPWCSPLTSLAFVVMEKTHKLPADYDLRRRLEDSQSLVWIFQRSGNATIDRRLRAFSLECLLHLAAQPTINWQDTLHVLCSCDEDKVTVLEGTLSEVIQHCMTRSQSRQPDCPADSLQSLREITSSRNLFMKNPLDRFVMLMSNAARKNTFVSLAFAYSGARDFVDSLQGGRFDYSKLDQSSESWRARTCHDVRLKLLDTD